MSNELKGVPELQIQYIKGVGPQRAKLLARLGIHTVRDALRYFPYRYEDRRNIRKIAHLLPGSLQTVSAKIIASGIIPLKKGLRLFEAAATDGSAILKLKWFNRPYLKELFKPGRESLFSGIPKRSYGGGLEMDNPEYEFLSTGDDAPIHTARIVPIYRVTEGLSVRQLRTIIFGALEGATPPSSPGLEALSDPLPADIRKRYGLPPLAESLRNTHFPDDAQDIDALNGWRTAHQRRHSFEELFFFQLGLALLTKERTLERGISMKPQGKLLGRLLKSLPFSLTGAQRKTFGAILEDMKSPHPMHRLLQGDVGSGKTVVALMAIASAVECGFQAALMAPTEILAEQHFISVHGILEGLGLKTALLTGSTKKRPLQAIASGDVNVVIGTHALIQKSVEFGNLGLVVIDEQHRFGVAQRAGLRKKGLNPDTLIMTATPIPRTLALTLYGDLDYSVIEELPPGRSPVMTTIIRRAEKARIYEAIRKEAAEGGQVYVVYPVIEGSEKTDLKSAIEGEDALRKIFPRLRIALIHGKMKQDERERVMTTFKRGELDILVSTTVIEVGVDVPNASLMVIVHAERFGLSQLHQLRGRVGRGRRQSRCMLLCYEPMGEDARRRLKVIASTTDGFKVAEEDLQIRGPGEFMGTRQSGLPDMRVANPVRDALLIEPAKEEAFKLVAQDAEMKGHPRLRASVEKFWQGRIELFKTG